MATLAVKSAFQQMVVEPSNGSGDFVMAELQSKLKGRGKFEIAEKVDPESKNVLARKTKATATVSPKRPLKAPEVDALAGTASFQNELKSLQNTGEEESITLLGSTKPVAVDGNVKTMCLNLESSDTSITEEGSSPVSTVSCKPTIVDLTASSVGGKSVKTTSENHEGDKKRRFRKKVTNGVSLIPQCSPKLPNAKKSSAVSDHSQLKTKTSDEKMASDSSVQKLTKFFSARAKDQTSGSTTGNSPKLKQPSRSPLAACSANNVLRSPFQTKQSKSLTSHFRVEEPIAEQTRSLASSGDETSTKASSSGVARDQSHGCPNLQPRELAINTTRMEAIAQEHHVADKKQAGNVDRKAFEYSSSQEGKNSHESQSKTEPDPAHFYENIFDDGSPRSSGSGGKTGSFTLSGEPIHFYQNVFDDDDQFRKFQKAHSSAKSLDLKKRPMPTPRTSVPDDSLKSPSQQTPSPTQSLTSSSISVAFLPENSKAGSMLQELQSELDLLQDVLSLPIISTEDKKAHRPVTQTNSQTAPIKRRTTPKSQKELRRGVVTDPEGDDEYIMMRALPLVIGRQGRSTSDLVHLPVAPQGNNRIHPNSQPSSSRSSEYYMTVLSESGTATRGQSTDSEESNTYMSTNQQNDKMVKAVSTDNGRKQEGNAPSRKALAANLKDWKRSQGSIFAQEMINFMTDFEPKPRRPFRSKTTAELRIPTGSWHEYVDIDFEQDGDKASCLYHLPPKIPPRPNVIPPRLLPRKTAFARPPSSGSVEYMYAPFAVNSSNAPHIKRSHSHNSKVPLIPPPCKSRGAAGGSALAPPILPPKSESMLREHMILQQQEQEQPSAYLIPISSKPQAKSGKRYKLKKILQSKGRKFFQPSPSPPAKSNPAGFLMSTKDVIRALKQETVLGKSKKQVKACAPPLASPPPTVIITPRNRSRTALTLEEQLEDISKECTSLDICHEFQRSYSTPNILDVPVIPDNAHCLSDSRLVSSKSMEGLDEEHSSLYLVNSQLQQSLQQCAPRPRQGTIVIHDEEDSTVVRREATNPVGKNINRKSLAIILQNREVLADRLGGQAAATNSADDPENPTVMPAASRRGKETLVRSLGDLLLEINVLLQNSSSCKKDLISAIEQELHLKLDCSRSETDSSLSAKQEDTSNPNSEERGATLSFPSPMLEITERDVQDVVDFVEANGGDNGELEEGWDSEETEEKVGYDYSGGPKKVVRKSPLRRSHSEATIIELDPVPEHSDSINSFHSDLDVEERPCEESPRDSADDEWHADFTQSALVSTNPKLRRANAKRRPSATADDILSTSSSNSNGMGFFTHKGGQLTNSNSSIVIEIPEGAIPHGRRQKLWFEVVQSVHRTAEEEATASGSMSSIDEVKMESLLRRRNENTVPLSPMVLVGPSDALLNQPIKIFMPHCIPTQNAAWNLKVLGRAQYSLSEDWVPLAHSSGCYIPKVHSRQKLFRYSTYQLHPHFIRVKTKQLGTFKLVGTPVGHTGIKTSKKIVCSIYADREDLERARERRKAVGERLQLQVIFVNAILDHVEILNRTMISEGYACIERNIPLLCHGNHKDMEVTILADMDEGRRPLDTKSIPYRFLWNQTKVGQARATFDLFPAYLDSMKVFAVQMKQTGMESQEIEIML